MKLMTFNVNSIEWRSKYDFINFSEDGWIYLIGANKLETKGVTGIEKTEIFEEFEKKYK